MNVFDTDSFHEHFRLLRETGNVSCPFPRVLSDTQMRLLEFARPTTPILGKRSVSTCTVSVLYSFRAGDHPGGDEP